MLFCSRHGLMWSWRDTKQRKEIVMAEQVTDATFESVVLKSDLPVLLDFWAPWCGPCQMLGPVIEELAQELAGKAKVVKVNIEEENQLASQYQVSSIPTVIIFANGQIKDTLVGLRMKEDYLSALNR